MFEELGAGHTVARSLTNMHKTTMDQSATAEIGHCKYFLTSVEYDIACSRKGVGKGVCIFRIETILKDGYKCRAPIKFGLISWPSFCETQPLTDLPSKIVRTNFTGKFFTFLFSLLSAGSASPLRSSTIILEV